MSPEMEPTSRPRQSDASRATGGGGGGSEKKMAQLEKRFASMMAQEFSFRRQAVVEASESALVLREQAHQTGYLLRWGFAAFRATLSAARQSEQLASLQERLAQTEERLRRSEQRLLCSEERLLRSEDDRQQMKARLCKAEFEHQRSAEWRRQYEASCPTTARSVAVAILEASSSGFARGITTLVMMAWAASVVYLQRARMWRADGTEAFEKTTSSNLSDAKAWHREDIDTLDPRGMPFKAAPKQPKKVTWSTEDVPAASRQVAAGTPQKRDSACIWVDSAATEQLSEAMATFLAFKKRSAGGAASPQRKDRSQTVL